MMTRDEHIEACLWADKMYPDTVFDIACLIWARYGVGTRFGRTAERLTFTGMAMWSAFECRATDCDPTLTSDVLRNPRQAPYGSCQRRPNRFKFEDRYVRGSVPGHMSAELHQQLAAELDQLAADHARFLPKYERSYGSETTAVSRMRAFGRVLARLRVLAGEARERETGASVVAIHG